MKYLMILFLAFVAAAPATQPASPTKPIELSTEIGSTASQNAKMSIELRLSITNGWIDSVLRFDEEGMNGERIDMPATDAAKIADAIDSVADKAESNGTGEESVGDIVMKAESRDGKAAVSIHKKQEGFGLSHPIYLDADNAMLVAKLVRKSQNVMAWLAPRIDGLKETRAK